MGDVPVALQQNHVARGNGKREIFSKRLEGGKKRMIPFQPPLLPCQPPVAAAHSAGFFVVDIVSSSSTSKSREYAQLAR